MSRFQRKMLAIVLVGLVVAAVAFGDTLAGLWRLRVTKWDEDVYIGRSLDELRRYLGSRHADLRPYDRFSLFGQTKRQLGPSERAFVYRHGERYSWFLVGEASNMGYVIARQTNSDPSSLIVVGIARGQQVDSL